MWHSKNKKGLRFMKKVVLILILIGFTAVFAFADNFILRNGTQHAFFSVYLSDSTIDDWEEDLLDRNQVIRPGGSLRIQLVEYTGNPMDILVIDEDGDTYTIHNRRIRVGETITITYADMD